MKRKEAAHKKVSRHTMKNRNLEKINYLRKLIKTLETAIIQPSMVKIINWKFKQLYIMYSTRLCKN